MNQRDTGRARLPALPPVTTQDRALQQWMQAVSERLEVREGSRGNQWERAVTLRDLQTLGIDPSAIALSTRPPQAGGSAPPLDGQYAGTSQSAFTTSILNSRLYQDLLRRLDDPARFDGVREEIRAILTAKLSEQARKQATDILHLEGKIEQTASSAAYAVDQVTASFEEATAGIRETVFSSASAVSAQAGKVTQIEARLDDVNGATIEESMIATADRVAGLAGEYMLKINAGRAVAGIGLAASEDLNGETESSFIVQADKFAIAPTYNFAQDTAPTALVAGDTWYAPATKKYYYATAPGSASWVEFSPSVPFGVDTKTGQVFINGQVRINAQTKAVKLSASSYYYNSTTSTPTSITITAEMLGGLSGTISFSTTAGTLSGTGNTRALSTSGIGASGATVTATVTDAFGTYTDALSIAYVANGTNGAAGSAGTRGSITAYASGPTWSAWSDATANNAIQSASGTTSRVIGDTVTISNGTNFAKTKYWSGTSWVDPGVVIDGNLLVNGTISGSKIIAGSITADKITSGTSDTTEGKFSLGGSSLIPTFNALIQSIVAANVNRGAVGGLSGSTDYPAVYGVNNASGFGGGFYSFSGSTKQTQLVGGYSAYAALAENIAKSKKVTLANASYALQSNTGQGKFYAVDGVGPFTGLHDGVTADAPEMGDIMVDHQILAKESISSVVAAYKVSSAPNQRGVIGVCSELFEAPPAGWGAPDDSPGDSAPVINPDVPEGHKVVHLNALGEGLINVCGEAGDLQLGDLIVASSMPGKGMRQADDVIRNYTVAKCREAVSFDYPEQVKQVACVYLCG